ncbi:MAG: alpha/beta hydrolase [bacterium]|nr:alpha/beta hydrolase [bacterium]MCP4965617.1 alpha/beta hydrolase [bacterium]
MQSHFIDVDGPTHYQETGVDGPVLILVHGIGASYLSWDPVVELLGKTHRVLAIDLIGFGFTPPHGRSASVQRNAELLIEFAETMTDQTVTLVGNSMGGLVSILAAIDRPDLVERLILVNPALPVVSMRSISRDSQRLVLPLMPLFGNSAARYYYHERTPEDEVDDTLRLVLSPGTEIDPIQRAAAIEMARARREMEWSIGAFTEAARSIAVELASTRRFRRKIHRVSQPTLMIHGTDDRVVHPASARWAAKERPDWRFTMIENMGHTPQLEDPELFVSIVEAWLSQIVPV